MILLQLNPYEVTTLSSFSKIKIETNSPLASHHIIESIDFNREGHQKAYETFLENKFLVPLGEDYTLADELEPAFMLLHRPEVSISIKRVREVNVGEVNFSFHSGFAMQMMSDIGARRYTFNYPHVLPSVGAWIRKEVFEHLKFEGQALAAYEVELSMEDMMTIFIYMSFIKMRVENKDDRLTAEECFISKEALKYFDRLDELESMMVAYIGDESLSSYIKSPAIDVGIHSLVQKGFLIEREDEVTISEFGKAIFNPANLSECYLVGEHLPMGHHLTTINVVSAGFVLLRTIAQEGPPSIQLTVLPPNTDAIEVMKIACPVAFMDGFGDEEAYRLKMEESEKMFMDKIQSPIDNQVLVEEMDKIDEQDAGTTNKFCVQCGNPLPLEAMFCSNCGAKQP